MYIYILYVYIYNRLYEFVIQQNEILYGKEFGFQASHSVE